MYDGTQYRFICWGVDNNTTYSNASLGQGYATCSTAEATAAKVGTLSSYALTTGGVVAVKFTYAVPANATLNINSKGAKAIYYKGAAITAGVIKAGDVATFIYNGSQYHLLTVDRSATSATQLEVYTGTTSDSNSNLYWQAYEWEISSSYKGCSATYSIIDNEQTFNGILSLRFRNGNSATNLGGHSIVWLTSNITNPPRAVLTHTINTSSVTYRLYIAYPNSWTTLCLSKINEIGVAGTAVQRQVTSLTGTLLGETSSTRSTYADSATKATQDASGNVITSTYATKTEMNSKADTSVATTTANGLMSKEDKAKLDEMSELSIDDLMDTYHNLPCIIMTTNYYNALISQLFLSFEDFENIQTITYNGTSYTKITFISEGGSLLPLRVGMDGLMSMYDENTIFFAYPDQIYQTDYFEENQSSIEYYNGHCFNGEMGYAYVYPPSRPITMVVRGM